jgi:hypothetical protein
MLSQTYTIMANISVAYCHHQPIKISTVDIFDNYLPNCLYAYLKFLGFHKKTAQHLIPTGKRVERLSPV